MNRLRRLAAALLAAAMCLGPAARAEAASGAIADQVNTALALTELDLDANSETVRLLLQQCVDALEEDDPVAATLRSVITLLDTGAADAASVAALLRSVVDSQPAAQDAPAQETPVPDTPAQATAQPSVSAAVEAAVSELGLPVYEAASFVRTVLRDPVLVSVPGGWGNNASGRALTSYSPVNDSGAISPAAGTLTISYVPMEGSSEAEALDSYAKNIANMSVTTAFASEDATAAELPARRLDFTMMVGANQFTCETVCFAYDQTVFAIELMQGQQTAYDYFPMYQQVVGSTEVGTEQMVQEVLTAQPTPEPEQAEPAAQPTPELAEPTAQPTPELVETPAPAAEDTPQGDMGTFLYEINGHTYQFPTAVRDMAEADLRLDRQTVIPYDFHSSADMADGQWTEIVNTQYYYFENLPYKEMIGVTNMTGQPAAASDCILTALIDTQGTYADVTLPGGVRVGGAESDILKGFPEFAGKPLDGVAGFRGNELLYACNVRDDGCNGYVLIRNDAPYYSAVSIICEYGVIKEISFECLGSVRANGVFL